MTITVTITKEEIDSLILDKLSKSGLKPVGTLDLSYRPAYDDHSRETFTPADYSASVEVEVQDRPSLQPTFPPGARTRNPDYRADQ